MFIEKEIPIYDFVYAISETVDLVSPVLSGHHNKVAYISCRIAQEMELPDDDIQQIILAAMLHDVGAFSVGYRLKLLNYAYFEADLTKHAFLGYKLLKNFAPFTKVAGLIKYHHTDFNKSQRNVPLGSYIIHLADRVSVLFDEQTEILEQVPEVCEKIFQTAHKFHPDMLSIFSGLANRECFWLEAFSSLYSAPVLKRALYSKKIIGLDTLRDFAKVIGQIIDFRSRFTATHSGGVAAVAQELSIISGFSERECKLMEIAGFLHDLGKMTVPNVILEKNGNLSNEEFNVMRKHTFYTHAVLNKITGMEDIAVWAAYHHERLTGNGYPFHVKGKGFPKLARIMAVADIFTALTEDRPYRLGMGKEKTIETLLGMAKNGNIDRSITELANSNFLRINEVRVKAQQEARNEYINFNKTANPFFPVCAMQSA